MMYRSPSIQSFYPPVPTSKVASSLPPSDGFSPEEITAVLDPSSFTDQPWRPLDNKQYADISIDDISLGPLAITFQGRIVNLFQQNTSAKRPQGAKGCNKFIVQDDSGCITVRLWFAHREYLLRLGQLVTIWATHISNGMQGNFSSAAAPLFVSIFPERDRNCHFMAHENSDDGVVCTRPLSHRENKEDPGLMTLQNFIDGGYDLADCKILVCVKSIGAKKKVSSKKEKTFECVNVHVFDHTADASLTLWNMPSSSAASWQPSRTILLITSPGWRLDRRLWLSLTSGTLVNVNPCIDDAQWLRRYARHMASRMHVNPSIPECLDFERARRTADQVLFTLADIDSFARVMSTGESFYGYVSLVIMELNLSALHRRRMLMCNECCGIPLFANTASAKCKQCNQDVLLAVNPKVITSVADETGSLTAGALLLTSKAWSQFLGASPEALCQFSWEQLRQTERTVLFSRKLFWFGWRSEATHGGCDRVCIAEIVD